MENVFRRLVRGSKLNLNDILLLFRTAKNFKNHHIKNETDQFGILLKGILVGSYTSKPDWCLTAISRATYLLGGNLHQLIMNDWEVCLKDELHELYKILLNRCDILLMSTSSTGYLDLFVEENRIPVINAGTGQNIPVTVLNQLFTMWEHFQNLKGLQVSWVGPSEALLNTFLGILPKLKMNMKYTCPKIPVSPINLKLGKKLCQDTNTNIKECMNLTEVLTDANIIITGKHCDKELTITEYNLKNAAPDCVLIYEFPRTKHQINPSLINSSNNLSYKVSENLIYTWMAILVLALKDYQPKYPIIEL